MFTIKHRNTKITFVALLSFMLFTGTFHGLLPGPSAVLSAQDLAGIFGAGFWSDPCTWDGFGAGIASVACAMGNTGGCGTTLIAIWKAIKLDNCF